MSNNVFVIIEVPDKFETELFTVSENESNINIISKYLKYKYQERYDSNILQLTTNSFLDAEEWCRYKYGIKIISEAIKL